MPKRYNVTPVLRTGTQYYVATFRDASGKRVCRGLGTPDMGSAQQICGSLVTLRTFGFPTIGDIPPTLPIHSTAKRLYFDLEESVASESIDDQSPMVQANQLVLTFAQSEQERLLPFFLELFTLRVTQERKEADYDELRRALRDREAELAQLRNSMLAKAAEAGKNMPSIPECLEMFREHMESKTCEANAKIVCAEARRFTAGLKDRRTLSEVTPVDMSGYLDRMTALGRPDKRASRRDGIRRRLSRLMNWAGKHWHFENPLRYVDAVSKSELDREKGEIHYHTKAEVESALKRLPDDYWHAIVASLGYAGLQLAELCWLRTEDVNLKAGTIRVTSVSEADSRHLLKTSHRERIINMHPKLLLPRLQKFAKDGHCGEKYFFAMPVAMRVAPDRERWLIDSLSTKLLGHNGGKRRKPSPALLPKGMNAKSLRRTFGSLLLRSGKKETEVAASMGNTPDVVRQHYAKIRGEEVKVNF